MYFPKPNACICFADVYVCSRSTTECCATHAAALSEGRLTAYELTICWTPCDVIDFGVSMFTIWRHPWPQTISSRKATIIPNTPVCFTANTSIVWPAPIGLH